MRINHNLAAANTYRQLSSNNVNGSKSLEKLSSGYRINRAGDDAAGLAISEKMRGQIRGLNMASKNSQDAISLIQTAEGALSETHSILQRMRELAVQSSNDTNVSVDREQVQKEMNQLTSEINRIGNTTEFNTQKLINGDRSSNIAQTFTAVATGTGISVTQNGTTSNYAAGTYTLEIDKSSGVTASTTSASLATVGVSFTSDGADIEFTGNIGVDYTDANNALKSAAGSVDAISTAQLDIEVVDATNIKVTISGANIQMGTVSTNIQAAADGSFSFDDFGIDFEIESLGGAAAGSKVTFLAGTASNTLTAISTSQEVWTTAPNLSTSSTLSVTVTAAAEAGTWKGTFNAGATTLTMEFAGDDGTTHCAVMTITALDTAVTFAANGVSFQISGAVTVSAAAGGVFEYTVVPKETFTATMKASTGTVVSTTTLATGFSGAGTAAFSATVTDFSITAADLSLVDVQTISVTVVSAASTDGSMNFQIGANQNQALNLSIGDMRANALNISNSATGTLTYTKDDGTTDTIELRSTAEITDGTTSVGSEYAMDVTDNTNASKAVTVLNNAINTVSTERSKLGASQNRLEHTINNLDTSAENLQASESRIRDVDMAKEMMEFTKNNILTQAAQAMLAQANQQPQGVLQLLR